MSKQKYIIIVTTLLVATLSAGAVIGSLSVAGESSTGEIRVAPNQTELSADESKEIDINYDTRSATNPEGVDFVIKYDPDIINVTKFRRGGYGSSSNIFVKNRTPGRIKAGVFKAQSGVLSDNKGTIATLTIELADGVNQSDTTDIRFTRVTIIEGSKPKTTDGTVKATESTQEERKRGTKPDVQITDIDLSEDTVDSSPREYTLSFDALNVSADGQDDEFAIRLPNNVTVVNINRTTITKRDSGEAVEIVGSDPAADPNPGNKISFTVDPEATARTQALTVEVKMVLSAGR